MDKVQKHFVTFASPGTFVPETSELPIDEWSVEMALQMAAGIVERHGARPYCFYFSTWGRGPLDLDSKEVATSPIYYFGVNVLTREDIEARNDPEEKTLRFNMRVNDIKAIVRPKKGWKTSLPLRDGDIVLDAELPDAPTPEPQP